MADIRSEIQVTVTLDKTAQIRGNSGTMSSPPLFAYGLSIGRGQNKWHISGPEARTDSGPRQARSPWSNWSGGKNVASRQESRFREMEDMRL